MRVTNNNPFAKLWFGVFLLLFWFSIPPQAIHSVVDAAISPERNTVPTPQARGRGRSPPTPRSLSKQKPKLKRRSPPRLDFHVINLDRDKERWESVVSELTSKGVPPKRIKRIEAVYGKNLTAEDLRTNTTLVARHFSTPGTIGCYLSHRSCWEQTVRGSNPYQLFLEDDVLVADNFQEKVAEILKEIDEDCPETKDGNWDVIFLGALGCVHPEGKYGLNRIAAIMSGGLRRPKRVLEGAPHCHVPKRPLGAHAYLLSKRGAQKLLDNCWRVSGHVDVVAWGMPGLTVVSVHPMLAHQNMGSVSTIGAITKGLETRLPKLVVDHYTGIVLEWVYNAPVLQLGPLLLTMGRSVTYILGGYVVAALLYDKHPWVMVVHTIVFGILFVLTKATTMRFGK